MILNDILKDYRLILASQSPRRKMLLEGLDLNFEVITKPGIDEDFPEDLRMLDIPVYLAESKAACYPELLNPKTIIITADTIVLHQGKLVGKPKNLDHAFETVKALAGGMHEVVTGVCLLNGERKKLFYSYSKVYFGELSDEMIRYYTGKYKPLDKAGAYGIQEWIGYVGIEKIEGSFYNVMGLPVQQLYQELFQLVHS